MGPAQTGVRRDSLKLPGVTSVLVPLGLVPSWALLRIPVRSIP